MKKKINLLALIAFFPGMLLAQSNFFVTYKYADTSLGKDFHFRLLKISGGPVKFLNELPPTKIIVKNKFSSEFDYSLTDTSIFMISYGFGHESFFIPGDSLSISFKKIKTTNGKFIINGKRSAYFNEINYFGKNKYIYSLFDSLAINTGSLFVFLNPFYHLDSFDAAKFFDTVTAVYHLRINYLNSYSHKYKIPANIQQLAFAEIKASYIETLIIPLNDLNRVYSIFDFRENYLDSSKQMNFSSPYVYFHRRIYFKTAYECISAYKSSPVLTDEDKNLRFKDVFRCISENINDQKLKERLLAFHLYYFVKDSYPSFGVLYESFKNAFPQSRFIGYIDSLYNVQNSKSTIPLDSALLTFTQDRLGNKTSFFNMMAHSKPVVVDCWASWCLPCLREMPFSKEIEAEYGDKVDYIYLSFDKDERAWLTKNAALGLAKSYLLLGGSKSNFARHFDIATIPRFIIFDKDGKLVTDSSPRPSDKGALKKIIDGLLNK